MVSYSHEKETLGNTSKQMGEKPSYDEVPGTMEMFIHSIQPLGKARDWGTYRDFGSLSMGNGERWEKNCGVNSFIDL